MFNHRTRILGWLMFVFLVSIFNLKDFNVYSFVNPEIERTQCNFDSMDCNWTRTDWLWQENSKFYSSMELDSPPYDIGGKFVLELLPGFQSSKMESPLFEFPLAKSICFKFIYYLQSVDDSEDNYLNFFLEQKDQDEKLIWHTQKIYGDLWYRAMIDINATLPFKIIIIAHGSTDLVAIRDFRILLEECPENGKICDFELNDCGWKTPEDSNSYKFERVSACTIDKTSIDHTYMSPYGHVLYLEGGTGSIATLNSPTMNPILHTQCFSFWLWIDGEIDQLDISLYQYFIGNSTRNLIWKWKPFRSLLSEWIFLKKSIDFSASSYLEFQVQGQAEGNKIKLDDFNFKPYACDPPVTCSFSNTICGWKNNNKYNNLDWLIGTGRVRNVSKLDFINSTNYYYEGKPILYTDFTAIQPSSDGRMELISDIVESIPSTGGCIILHYKIWSFQDGDFFGLYSETLGNASESNLLWQLKNFSAGEETYEQIFVSSKDVPRDFRFVLQAISNNPSTYIVVSFLSFVKEFETCGSQTEKPTTSTPTTPIPTVKPSLSLNCNFENGNLCDWINEQGFKLSQANDTKYGIFNDHTTKNENGHFASFDTGEAGVLRAKNPFNLNSKICLTFYYWFYTALGSKMQLSLRSATSERILYQGFEANMIKWRKTMIELKIDEEFDEFVFKVNLPFPGAGIFAIDDINAIEDECKDLIQNLDYCDFEMNTTCMFRSMYSDSGVWNILPASKFENMIDHTTHSQDGHFYGLSINGTSSSSDLFEMTTDYLWADKYYCLRFSYYLTDKITLFYKKEDETGETEILWSVSGTTNNLWFTHQTPLKGDDKTLYKLRFGIRPTHDLLRLESALAAIDDVEFHEGYCRKSTFCDFEDGDTCTFETIYPGEHWLSTDDALFLAHKPNYTFLSTDYLTDYNDFYWEVYSPEERKSFIDHDDTWGDRYGKYLLSDSRLSGARSVIITERYPLTRENRSICLYMALYSNNFQYIVEVYQGESTFNDFAMKIWNLNQSVTTDWKTFEILATAVNDSSKDIFFYIVATSVNSPSYIALDDMGVKDKCSNPSNEFTSTTSLTTTSDFESTTKKDPYGYFDCGLDQLIPMEKVCDYKFDCKNRHDEIYCGNCEFSDHFACYYDIETTDKPFKFRFTDQAPHGPKDLYFRSSITASSDTLVPSDSDMDAWLSTQQIHQSYMGCDFVFRYRFFSTLTPENHTSLLDLYILLDDTGIKTKLWQDTASKLSFYEWNHVMLRLNRIKHTFKLAFRAKPFPAINGYHSLAMIEKFDCEPPEYEQSCEEYEFHCNNDACIDEEYVCDMNDDCGDGSDEADCDQTLRFSFEDGLKGWGETYKDSFSNGWHLKRSSSLGDLRVAPTFDHTSDFAGGTYLFINSNTTDNNHAIIDSPIFKITGEKCRLKLYLMKNSDNSTLFINLWNYKTGKVTNLKTIYSDFLTFFPIISFISGPSNDPHKILIEAKLNRTKNNFVDPYMAIDDIVFSKECQWMHGDDDKNITTPKPCDGIECLNENGTKFCLPPQFLCDFIKQCKYGEDEVQCGDCKFDNHSTCGWIDSQDSKYYTQWTLFQPAMNAPDPLPNKDADNSSTGGYIAIHDNSLSTVSALLIGPRINGKTSPECAIQFMVRSEHSTNLKISIDNGRVIHEDISVFNLWTTFRTVIGEENPPFQIYIEGTNFDYFDIRAKLYIAIDNIKMMNCNPSYDNDTRPMDMEKLNCDFETDLCGWIVPGLEEKETWFRTNLFTDEPGNDHTSLIVPQPHSHGFWLSTQTKLEQVVQNQLRSVKPLKSDSQSTYCLTFWYYYFGIETATFKIFLEDAQSKSNTTIWIRKIPDFRFWKQASVELKYPANFYIYLEADVSTATIVGIDDIKMYNQECPIMNHEYCDFETNLCDWSIANNQMERQSEVFRDHTTGTMFGHYVADQTVNQIASINRKLNNLPFFINNFTVHDFCFNLYYYFGSQPSPLDHSSYIKVRMLRLNAIKDLENVTILESANQKSLNTWSLLSVNFKAAPEDILIVSIFRVDERTQIAIDDITIKSNPCSDHGSCDFEYDMCGWHNNLEENPSSNNNNILWVRVQPVNRYARKNGLPVDHTLGKIIGNYLALPLDMQGLSLNKVILDSPILTRKESVICLRLFYFAQTIPTNGLIEAIKIQLINLNNSTVESEHSIYASIERDWTKFENEFANVPSIYLLRIVSQYHTTIISDIGVDDIDVIQGPCKNDDHSTLPTSPSTPIPDTEKVADCNFETKCDWIFQKDSWNITSFIEDNQRNIYIPQEDHTYHSAFGHYLMFTYHNNDYDLNSPAFKYDKDRCLSLWYYNDGEDPFYLSFYESNQNDTSIKLIGRYGSTMETRRWQLIRINLPHYPEWNISNMRIKINFRPSKDKIFAVFAIDDLQVRPGFCPHYHDYTYTFTGGLEDLQVLQTEPNDKSLASNIYSGDMGQKYGAPLFDHTTYSPQGYYFIFMNHIQSSYYADTLEMLHLPPESASVCVRFAYQSKGVVYAKIYVLQEDQPPIDWKFILPIWKLEYAKSFWTIEEFNVLVDYQYKIMFDLEKPGTDVDSYFAIDDLTILQQACTIPIDCDFDQRYCSYTPHQNSQTNYRWEVFNTPAIDLDWPGPKYDHTTKTNGGGYLFLTAFRSGKHTDNLIAEIVSGARKLRLSNYPHCLTMWTIVNNYDASLHVYIYRYGPNWTDQNRTIKAFVIENVVQLEWIQLSFTLNESTLIDTREMQILIEGRLGTDPMNAIAIDDISLSQGECDTKGLLCENGVRISQDKICNFILDCPSGIDELNCGNCTFEADSCGWETMEKSGYHKWERVQVNNSLLVNSRAPKFDATGRKDGHFMLMKPNERFIIEEGGYAEFALHFQHPELYLKNSYKICELEFDFYIDTAKDYFIEVSYSNMINSLNTFFTVSRESMGGWRKARTEIGTVSGEFFIDFFAYQKDLTDGVIAIDEINLKNCRLPPPLPKKKQCPDELILCNETRICIRRDDICDNVNDCGNREDEKNCEAYHICSFSDFYSCDITKPSMDSSKVEWQLSNGNIHRYDKLIGYEPLIDNTMRTAYGNYFLLQPKHQSNQTIPYADFYTPIFKTSSSQDSCVFRFFFYMHADPDKIVKEKLEIYIRRLNDYNEPSMTLLMIIKGDYYEQQRWNKRIAKEKSTIPFQFVIRGYLNDNRTRMAIDDLSYGIGCIKQQTTTSPPTSQPIITTSTTNIPFIPSKHRAGISIAAIMVPIFLSLIIVAGYYGRRRYRSSTNRTGTFMTMSMRDLDEIPLETDS